MKLELAWPVKPLHVNQGFGTNPDYYARFNMKGHNGLDLMAQHGQPVYAPCDGFAWYSVDDNKGDGVYIMTGQEFDYKLGQAYFKIVLWHLCPANDPQFPIKIPTDGQRYPIKCGDLVGYADNTGAPFESTGDHLHLGTYPLMIDGTELEAGNGFNAAIDPTPYMSGLFAEDIATARRAYEVSEEALQLSPLVKNPWLLNQIYNAIITLLKKVADFLNK